MSAQDRKTIGVVATPHHLATSVGAAVLKEGGNAFDAMVAISLAIGVVQPYHSGIGGGCNITWQGADGANGHVQARGPAPAKLTRDLFLKEDGAPDYELVKAGGLAIAVPTLIAGLRSLHSQRGQRPWAQVCRAPLPLAADGFTTDFLLERTYRQMDPADKLTRYAPSATLQEPFAEGQRVSQPALAATLETIAQDPDALYSGALGTQIASHVQSIGGVLEQGDLSSYRPKQTALLACSYRGWRILAPGLPTIGALQTMLTLQILNHFDVGALTPGSGAHLHLVAEAIKLSYMARAECDSNASAAAIAQPENAARLTKLVRMERAIDFASGIAASGAIPRDAGSCTSHFCVADGAGNVVSQTQTVRSYFGSGVIEPSSGIVLNDTISDFSLQPGEVTTQGIRYNGEFNLLAPGAESASSQSPIIAIHPETGDIIAAGAAGGPKIVSATVQALVNCIDFGMSARASAAAPRVHCHGAEVEVEGGNGVAARLEALGHSVKKVRSIAIMQTIRCTDGVWDGGADPRGPGAAAVVSNLDGTATVRSYGYWVGGQ